jgi:Yip1 domain
MIKALLLIFSSAATWQRIAETPRKWGVILAAYLLPMLLLACAAEGYGLVHWGKLRGELTKLTQFSISQAVVYEAAQFILALAIVFIAAGLIKSLGETFHGRHNFSQTFTVAAYGLSPVFLLRLLDAFPAIPPWVTWLIGIVLTISILYSGIPLVMRPDPPHALGLYLMTSMFLFMITGLTRFVTAWYLKGEFTKLDALISHHLTH